MFEHGYTACRKAKEMGDWFPHIKTNWVPWTLANPGLFAGILQASCHNLILLNPDNTLYPRLLLKYKADAIHELRKALSQKEERASDTTIALAFMLAVEEVSTPSNKTSTRLDGELMQPSTLMVT